MKKIIASFLILVSVVTFVACSNKAELEVIHQTVTGKVMSINLDEEMMTVLDENTNEEVEFIISLLMPDSKDENIPYVETLSVGDRVTVEAEYAIDCESPYPAMKVSEAKE